MTDYTNDEEKANNEYFLALRKAWISFEAAWPYKHWLIEVTSNPASLEAESLARPIGNGSDKCNNPTHWRPITMSCEGINKFDPDDQDQEDMFDLIRRK